MKKTFIMFILITILLWGCSNDLNNNDELVTEIEETKDTKENVEMQAYQVEFTGKDIQPQEEYNTICDYCKFYYTFTNNTDNMVKGIQGTFRAFDKFGDEIFVSDNCKLIFIEDRAFGNGSHDDYILLGVSGQNCSRRWNYCKL